jgi:hypothetical protein
LRCSRASSVIGILSLFCRLRPGTEFAAGIENRRHQGRTGSLLPLLHDAYVSSGFMTPDPSGMRVTIYHALPTTTTLCAKLFDQGGRHDFPDPRKRHRLSICSAFSTLSEVREQAGYIAEVSALAIHPKFRRAGGTILFPLMKFMYEYCTTFFDTRHLVIAVNPRHIEPTSRCFSSAACRPTWSRTTIS